MTNTDQRIADALRQDSPPPRDPAFRIQLLERRERQRFRRRSLSSLAAAAAVTGISAVAVSAGGASYTAGSVLLFALVLVLAGVVYLPGFGRLVRSLSVQGGNPCRSLQKE
jgi:phytoene dehydrogenase-like protein